MKTVKDFNNHWEAIEEMDNIDTNCLVHAIGKRYGDYIATEGTNLRNIGNGDPMEYEAEAAEARWDVKDGLRVLEKRSDLVETLEAFVDAHADQAILDLTLAANHFRFTDIVEAIDAAKNAVDSGMVHMAELYEAPNWKVPGEDGDDDIYL